jgi:LPS export ABC transporter protein LptC
MRPATDRTGRLIQRAVTIIALLAGGALLFEMLAGADDEEIETETAVDGRGYYLNDARLTELGADGRPRVVVRAQAIEQRMSDQSVQLTGLDLDYSTQQQGQWHVTADRGRMPSDRGSLQLQGNVRVEGAAQNDLGRAIIRTDELAYDTRANVVQTAAPVTVEIGPHELRGRGLRVGLNEGKLRLESNVYGQFKP